MTIELKFYKPAEGAALSVTALNDNENLSEVIAWKLYEKHAMEVLLRSDNPNAQHNGPDGFKANQRYELDSGLIFRLHDDGAGRQEVQFSVTLEKADERDAILATIPDLILEAEPQCDNAQITRIRNLLAQTSAREK